MAEELQEAMDKNIKPTLCLDFDGVIHSYTSGWQGVDVIPDPPVIDEHGVSAIEKLYEYIEHFDVCVYSSRSASKQGVEAMQAWLSKWDDAYWASRPDQPRPRTILIFCIRFPVTKPAAFVGIDDRVITFNGAFPDVETLRNFKPWNKR